MSDEVLFVGKCKLLFIGTALSSGISSAFKDIALQLEGVSLATATAKCAIDIFPSAEQRRRVEKSARG